MDKCLFIKSDMICLVYVDDTIIDRSNAKSIEEENKISGFDKMSYVIHMSSVKKVKFDNFFAYALNDRNTWNKLYYPGLKTRFIRNLVYLTLILEKTRVKQ